MTVGGVRTGFTAGVMVGVITKIAAEVTVDGEIVMVDCV